MRSHNYLVLAMATAFMVINLLGVAFTIQHIRSRRMQQPARLSTNGIQPLANSRSFLSYGVLATVAGVCAAVALIKVGQVLGLW